MNTAFTRLLWKEFRTQRMLWTVLMLGALMFYTALRLTVAPWTAAISIAILFGILFIVTSFSMTFAGEIDDNTAGLLRMLPCRTSTLFVAKIVVSLGNSISLALAILGLSLVIEPVCWMFPELRRPQSGAVTFDVSDALSVAYTTMLLAAAALFSSLIARKVISAVGMAAIISASTFAFVALQVNPIYTNRYYDQSKWSGGVAVLMFAVASIFLLPSWHLGRLRYQRFPFSFSLPSRFSNHYLPTISNLAPYARTWQWLQHTIVNKPHSRHRMLTMLAWRECRSALPFAATWLSLGTLLCLGRCFVSTEYPFPLIFALAYVLECGQRTMRDDQRSGAVSMLANMGVPAFQIWLVKITCWLGFMIVGVALITLFDNIVPSYNLDAFPAWRELRIVRILDSIRIPATSNLSMQNLEKFPANWDDRWLQLGVMLSVILGLFSIGQLTAWWIRKQIVAFGAALPLALGMGLVVAAYLNFDISTWLGLVPVPLCLLLATANTARSQLDRIVDWPGRMRQIAWLIVSCVLFPLTGLLSWRYEPAIALAIISDDPGLPHDEDSRNPAILIHPQNKPQSDNSNPAKKLLLMQSLPTIEWRNLDDPTETKCWNEFADALKETPLHELVRPQKQDSAPADSNSTRSTQVRFLSEWTHGVSRRAGIASLLQPFDVYLNQSKQWPDLPIHWTAPWSETPAVPLTAALLEDARFREEDNDIEGAIRQMLRAIRLNRSLSTQTSTWSNWQVCLDAECVALGRLRLLVGTADLSSVLLDHVFEELKNIFMISRRSWSLDHRWQDPRLMLRRRTLFYSAVAAEGNVYFDRILSSLDSQLGFELWSRNLLKWHRDFKNGPPGKFARDTDVIKYAELILQRKYDSMQVDSTPNYHAGHQSVQENWDRLANLKRLSRWMATSHYGDLGWDEKVAGRDDKNSFLIPHLNTIASERATLLTVMLQQYRVDHGKFPDSLRDLPNNDRLRSLIQKDPWTGVTFEYDSGSQQPQGTISILAKNRAHGVSSKQPIVCSGGGFGRSIETMSLQLDNHSSIEVYELPPNVVLFTGLWEEFDWRYAQIATTVKIHVSEEF